MTDQQQRAGPVDELLLQQLQRLEIQIVGWLVEHEDVRRPREEARQQQAIAFTTRQRLDRRSRALVREEEVAQIRVHVARPAIGGDRIVSLAHCLEHRLVGIELLALLIVVRDLDRRPAAHFAGVGRRFAKQHPQQRRLAGAVRADEADAIAAHDACGEGLNPELGAWKRFRDTIDFEHQFARRIRRLRLQAHAARLLAPLGAFRTHRHQRADTSLVARAPRLDALSQPGFLFGELLVEALLRRRLDGQRLVLPSQIRGVVARPRGERSAIDLDDPCGEALQKRAVVRDEHHGAGVIGQERLEPGDGVDVEMVRRLVEQEEIGLAHQRAREQHAATPSTRQRVDDGLGRQLQPRQDEIHVVLAQPLLINVEVMRMPFGHDVEHRAVGRKRDVLLETRDPQPRLTPDGAAVGRQVAADDLQER